jgi:hypothetical protein
VVKQIEGGTAGTPSHIAATIKLDTDGRSHNDGDMFSVSGDGVTGLARKTTMSPDVEFEVK